MGLLNATSFTRRSSATSTLASYQSGLSNEELINDEESCGFQQRNIANDGDIPATSNARALPKRWIPKKNSGLFTSFNSKRNHCARRCASSLPSDEDASSLNITSTDNDPSNLLHENNGDDKFDGSLNKGGGSATASRPPTPRSPIDSVSSLNIDVTSSEDGLSKLLPKNNDEDNLKGAVKNESGLILYPDASSSDGSPSFVLDDGSNNDLGLGVQVCSALDSETMISAMSDSPSFSELARVAAVRAKECINECLDNDTLSDILDRQKWESIPQYTKNDLLVRKHLGKGSFSDAFEVSVMVTVGERRLDSSDKEDLDKLMGVKFATTNKISEGEADDKKDDLDKEIGVTVARSASLDEPIYSQPDSRPIRRLVCSRRQTMNQDVCASFCVRETQASTRPVQKKQMTYAMKCLRPQIRSNAEQVIVGVEDLVRETAMLVSLDHPNIIKLHGRAISNSFHIGDGYFILLDRLQDTLGDRMAGWKKMMSGEKGNGIGGGGKGSKTTPLLSQLKTACSIADALSYLHSKNIVFRDLKPANVGYDSRGILKLFDFGFAAGVKSDADRLHDVCGTPRYMAPEVGLGCGYSFPVDVHSFGILLWEILSLKKPFMHLKSPEEFKKIVFEEGLRPKLARGLPKCLKDVMTCCWGVLPGERPTMTAVAEQIKVHMREVSLARQVQHGNARSLRKSSLFRRRRLTTV